MSRSRVTAKRPPLPRSSSLGLAERLEEHVPEGTLIVEPLQALFCREDALFCKDNIAVDLGELVTRNGMFMENRSTFTMKTSHSKAHISDTYTKQSYYMQKNTEQSASSNSELRKLTKPESKRSSEKQQNLDFKKQHVESKMSDAKKYLNSSDTKEAKVLAISATTVETYNLGSTSSINNISEDSGKDDDANDGEEGDDDDDDDVDDEGSKREERRAPIELMGEFLKAIMDRDYKLSIKLCQMILIYEPENSEAKQFKTLLEVKLQFDEAASTHQNDEEDSTESDSSDEDDSEDSNNEDSDENERSDEESVDSSESEEST
ncbi:glutamate-rich protein 2 isoform X2 [Heptranchias perlo]|uniref:glutamate-rich protein 2 isoform X2 n=1 Tax=Heptranchias perlo TaxID=212740 RepID=UPI00355ACC59